MRLRFLLPLLALLPAFPAFSQEADTLVFVTQWKAQTQFAGYYVAEELGFYEEEGVPVSIIHPFSTQPAVDRVRKYPQQAVMLTMDEALKMVDAGIPVINILQTSMNSALAVYAYTGESPLTLDHPKVAVWQVGYDSILRCWAEREGLDYEWIPASSTVSLLVTGTVDASAVMTYNEYFKIRQRGRPEPKDGLYRLSEHGYNIQQDGVYMTRAAYEAHKEQAEAFARASRRGWEWAAGHREEAVRITMKRVKQNRVNTNRLVQTLMLDEVLRLQQDPDSGVREFRLRPDMVEKASRMMFEAGILKREISMEELLP